MKCFHFLSREGTDEQRTQKSTPVLSSPASMSTDHGLKRSGSELNSQDVSEMSTESSSSSLKITNSLAFLSKRHGNNLREFSYSELKTATKSFSRSLMLGEGGFGGVYRGVIKDSDKKIDVAVKQLSRRGCQGHKEWVTEVNMLGVVEHPNLVKLLGYCAEDDERGIQRLLVYEYMPNRSVQDHLTNMVQTPLSWSTRLKIARDAAQGLAYLHEGMDFQIIFRDFKSSNILLDDQWNAKLSDFGLARLGPSNGLSHVSTAVVGTIGYAAPEYIQTGRLTCKNDVWSYGVFLYELITGRRPVDRNRPRKEENLIEWVRLHLSDVRKFETIIDPRLEGKYSLKCAMRLADVANHCLVRQPKKRPKISQVIAMVNQIVEGAELERPQVPIESKSEGCEESKREGVKQWLVDPLLQGLLIWRTWKTKIIVGIC